MFCDLSASIQGHNLGYIALDRSASGVLALLSDSVSSGFSLLIPKIKALMFGRDLEVIYTQPPTQCCTPFGKVLSALLAFAWTFPSGGIRTVYEAVSLIFGYILALSRNSFLVIYVSYFVTLRTTLSPFLIHTVNLLVRELAGCALNSLYVTWLSGLLPLDSFQSQNALHKGRCRFQTWLDSWGVWQDCYCSLCPIYFTVLF